MPDGSELEQPQGGGPDAELRAASPRPPRRRWGRTGRDLFLHFVAVLLGVALGTAAATWREDRAAVENRDRTLRGLAGEVAHNRAFLAARVAYWRQVLSEIDAARAAKGAAATLADVPAMRGLNPPFFRRAAYEVSFHSGAFARFEYDLAERIAATYAVQEWMLAGVDKTADLLIQRSERGFRMEDMYMVFQDWVQMGGQLLGAYEELAQELPPAKSPAPRPQEASPAPAP